MDLKTFVRDIPDFPNKGILFKDITPILRNAEAFAYSIDQLRDKYKNSDISAIVGAEARGFIFGAPLAYALNAGFIPARKPGKLPHDTTKAEYQLEYGVDSLELHTDSINNGDRILIVDDVLATGGTAAAKIDLVRQLGGDVVGVAFLIELKFLNGRDKLPEDIDVFSLIQY